MSLIPFAGPWTRSEAAHLLRRTIFGPTHQQITAITNMTMTDAVNQLLTVGSLNPPLAYDAGETVVAKGQTWVNCVMHMELRSKHISIKISPVVFIPYSVIWMAWPQEHISW